jgi:hypothetical protein
MNTIAQMIEGMDHYIGNSHIESILRVLNTIQPKDLEPETEASFNVKGNLDGSITITAGMIMYWKLCTREALKSLEFKKWLDDHPFTSTFEFAGGLYPDCFIEDVAELDTQINGAIMMIDHWKDTLKYLTYQKTAPICKVCNYSVAHHKHLNYCKEAKI